MRKLLTLCLSLIALNAWGASDKDVQNFQAELNQVDGILGSNSSGFRQAVDATKAPGDFRENMKQYAPFGDVEAKHMASYVHQALGVPGQLFMKKSKEERKASDYTNSALYNGVKALGKKFDHIENTTPKQHGTPAQQKHFVKEMTALLAALVKLLKENPHTVEELRGE